MLSTPYNPYENRSYKIVISTAVGFSLATSALILRLFCRWLCHKRLELNDFFIIAAYVCVRENTRTVATLANTCM